MASLCMVGSGAVGRRQDVAKATPVQRLSITSMMGNKKLAPQYRIRALQLLGNIDQRENGTLGLFRSSNAREDYRLRSRLKREAFQRRTWDKKSPRFDTGKLRVSQGGKLSLPKRRTLTEHDWKMVNNQNYGRGISKGARMDALSRIPRDLRLVRGRDVAFPAAGMAAGAGLTAHRSHRQGDNRGRTATATASAAGAGGAGELAFRTTGMAIRDKGNRLVRTERPGQTKSQRKKAESEWRNKHGISGSSSSEARMAIQSNYKAMRDYPKSNAAAPYKRMLGHMSGPKGRAIEAGAIAAPMAAVYALNRRQVGKSAEYGYRETKRSIPRTAEMLGGLGLLAYGAPRLKMLGPAAAKGIKYAEKHGAGKEARAALELAQVFGARSRELTGRGETKLRQIRTLDRAISAVPRGIRGEVATAAGVLAASNAHPTTKQRFVPAGEYG